MRGQRLAGIFVQFWAVLCAKSATNNLRVLITEIAEPPILSESATKPENALHSCRRSAEDLGAARLPDPGRLLFPTRRVARTAPARRKGTPRGLLREFPAAPVRASPDPGRRAAESP